MNIAVNVTPLHSGHKDRGIGYYTKNLIEYLNKDSSIKLQEFIDIKDIRHADIVHYPWFDLFFHTLPIRKKYPTVVTVHDVIPLIFKDHYPVGIKGNFNFILQKIALNSSKYIITDSKKSKVDIENHLNVTGDKISTCYLATSGDFGVLSDTETLRFKRQLNIDGQFILYVGDANWVKNLPFLIEGFSEIVKQPAFNGLKLVLLGGVFLKKVEGINHPELESIKILNRKISNLGLEDKVIRPGNVSKQELTGYYNLATLYVQPSLYEGFGLPVLEAMSCGAPVICSDRGSLPEVGGDAVIYFDPTKMRQFVSVVSDVLENKYLQSKLSNLGLKRAQVFSWERFIEEIKRVYFKASNNG